MIDFNHGVYLSYLQRENLAVYFQCRNHPAIRKWCRQYDVLDWQTHLDWFVSLSDRKDTAMYEIRGHDDTFLGVCGLTSIDRVNSRAEFSLYIRPDMHRRGFAKAALKTLCAHGFLNHNLNVIWGECFEGNPALDIFLKLGFANEGIRHEFYYRNGKYIDATLVSLCRSEFDDLQNDWQKDKKTTAKPRLKSVT